MTYVYVQALGKKSLEQRRSLVREVTRVVASALEVKADEIRVTLDEVEAQNFGVGGVLWADKGQ